MFQPPFISEVSLPEYVRVEENILVKLQGNWPNPTWKHNKTDIDINTENKIVKIVYNGVSSGGMAMQVLKPFRDTVDLRLSQPGIWKIHIIGRGQKIERTITVVS